MGTKCRSNIARERRRVQRTEPLPDLLSTRRVVLNHLDRGAQGDHLTNGMRRSAGQLARIDTTEAPANESDGSARLAVYSLEEVAKATEDLVGWTQVLTEAPSVGVIAEVTQEMPQRARRPVAGGEARKDDHVMTVALGQSAQKGQCRRHQGAFIERSDFQYRHP